MEKLIAKAKVLLEALPYIQRFAGTTVVIKYGGNAMVERKLQAGFAEDIVLLQSLGLRPVVVHGGGPQIESAFKSEGIESRFIDGRRVTDDKAMRVVERVLGTTINREIVNLIKSHGGKAVGLGSRNGKALNVRRLGSKRGEPDLGRVGHVESVCSDMIEGLTASARIPVIAPLGVDEEGLSYNVNADTAAAEIAVGLAADKLMILTDVAGVRGQSGSLQAKLSASEARQQIKSGVIKGGMLPKIESALRATAGGVSQVHIIDGRVTHAVLLEIFTDKGVGTEIVPRAAVKKAGKRSSVGG